MPLQFKSTSRLLAESYDRLIRNTGITNVSPGGTARTILEILAEYQGEQNQLLQTNLLQAFVTRATGEYLDRIGEVYGLTRRSSTLPIDRTTSNFKFFLDEATGLTAQDLADEANQYLTLNNLTDENITANGFIIPNNTTITSLGGVEYATTETATFVTSDTEVYVPVVGSVPGKAGNVGAGQLKTHDLANVSVGFTPIASVILADNDLPITSGTNRETDQNFRFRIVNATVGNAGANETSIRLAALSVPGVRDVRLRRYSFGIGTFSVFIIGDHPIVSDGLLGAVRAAVQRKSAAGIKVYVDRPTYKGMEFELEIFYKLGIAEAAKLNLQRSIRRTVVNYINNIIIGGKFIVNELIQRVLGLSESIEDMRIISMRLGTYNIDSNVNKESSSVLITNQTLDWDEQFYCHTGLVSICESR